MRNPFFSHRGIPGWNAARLPPGFFIATFFLTAPVPAFAADANLAGQIESLREQNLLLQKQVERQGDAIDALTQKVRELENAGAANGNSSDQSSVPTTGGFNLGKVNLSAEGGVAFFDTGSDGFAPHPDFRVDETRLFVEAPIWQEVYFYSDVDLATRENTDTTVQLGELYLDFQDASQLWGKDSQFNVRAGRMFIPFGEEYMKRYAMENPLISHSLADFWGISPGVEVYGALGKFSYVVAVQNSELDGVQAFEDDKSVTGRIGYDPNEHWHFSVSGMRTGNINAQPESLSAMWFANGFFHPIGSPATTAFHADLVEGDLTARWHSGHVGANGGYVRYGDNDPAADNGRDAYYYSVEAEQNLPHKFYTAARFSQILANKGFPIVGYGNFDDYLFSYLTTELWRLSLGIGYRFNDRLVVKTEYSFEQGTELGGGTRDHEDFFGTEAAFKF